MGFSAGGELTLLSAMRADATNSAAADTIDRENDRPDFVALMYPGGLTPEIITKVTKDLPPAFMLCGADDRDTIAQLLPQLFVAWRKAGVSAELHEYAGVGHGFGLRAEPARRGGGLAPGVRGVDGYEGISCCGGSELLRDFAFRFVGGVFDLGVKAFEQALDEGFGRRSCGCCSCVRDGRCAGRGRRARCPRRKGLPRRRSGWRRAGPARRSRRAGLRRLALSRGAAGGISRCLVDAMDPLRMVGEPTEIMTSADGLDRCGLGASGISHLPQPGSLPHSLVSKREPGRYLGQARWTDNCIYGFARATRCYRRSPLVDSHGGRDSRARCCWTASPSRTRRRS